MNYYSEDDIREIVKGVLAKASRDWNKTESPKGQEVPVEISARHVHLTQEAVDVLFGKGYLLTKKRSLSQPGQYLAEERVKLVTAKGQLSNIAILGPVRPENQVELSLTDARILGVTAPICLSGDLEGAADVVIVGPKGVITAKRSVMIAKAHVHMTPEDAKIYGVKNNDHVSVQIGTERKVTLNDVIVRVSGEYALAVHIDFDEANAAQISGNVTGLLIKNG